jgi:uncharacterized protein (DUF1330 family)
MGKLILVVGGIGVGKTALVRALCKQGPFVAGLEEHDERPFQRVFKIDSRYALRQPPNFASTLLSRRTSMSAYVIVDIEVTNPSGYEEYKKLAPAAVKLYGGKYLARGCPNETLEGGWKANRLVILEFENTVKAKTWLNSPEYAPARSLRHEYARSKLIVVEGV